MGATANATSAELNALVTEELVAIPRGGFYQNMYRMAYEQARLNGLGSRPEVAATSQAAHEVALRLVRQQQPDFVPVLLG
jgi:aspartokinase-like uncharacterized kinase